MQVSFQYSPKAKRHRTWSCGHDVVLISWLWSTEAHVLASFLSQHTASHWWRQQGKARMCTLFLGKGNIFVQSWSKGTECFLSQYKHLSKRKQSRTTRGCFGVWEVKNRWTHLVSTDFWQDVVCFTNTQRPWTISTLLHEHFKQNSPSLFPLFGSQGNLSLWELNFSH